MSEGPRWTAEQKLAIETRGANLLVSASAGTGKTAVLVERIIGLATGNPPVDIERFLVVTFTEKAASEMKARVRAALNKKAAENPGDPFLNRQLHLLDKAQISTIHAFCLQVLRKFFYRVDLDPSFRVLDTGEADLLKQDAIDEVFEEMYEASEVFADLVDMYGGRGVDEGLKDTVNRLHDFASTQPSMDGWLDEARGFVSDSVVSAERNAVSLWRLPWTRSLLRSAVRDLDRARVLAEAAREICLTPNGPALYLNVVENEIDLYSRAKELAEKVLEAGDERSAPGSGNEIEKTSDKSDYSETGIQTIDQARHGGVCHDGAGHRHLELLGENFRQILGYEFARLPSIRKAQDPALKDDAQKWRNAAKDQFRKISDYAFTRPAGELVQEQKDLAPYMDCLITLVKKLDVRYTAKKLDRGGLDFSDLERYCLLALSKDNGEVATQVRSEFDYVLVDEYQDTNPVQEALIKLLTRDGEKANLFTVGDIKQSIYRFRLAEPRIFLERHERYAVAATDGVDSWDELYTTNLADTADEPSPSNARGASDVRGTSDTCGASEQGEISETYPGLRVDLSTNFRSRREVLDAANWVFERIMQADVADIDYDDGHRLRLGAGYPACDDRSFVAELHLLERRVSEQGLEPESKQGPPQPSREPSVPSLEGADGRLSADDSLSSDASDLEDYEAIEKEALAVASRIVEMVDPRHPLMLWDAAKKVSRPCSYKDITILMRSTKDRANAVLEVLGKAGIPSYADTATGYFRAREVEIALSLLSVMDNPRQDIPLAAVLRSPIVGLTAEDLAAIRVKDKEGAFYDAVVAAAGDGIKVAPAGSPVTCTDGLSVSTTADDSARDGQSSQGDADGSLVERYSRLSQVLREFLTDLDRWRTMARRKPLAEVLWTILRETGYEDYVGGLPGGAQRQANLRVLCDRARQFDSFGHHGLFRFLRFIERIQESDGDLGAARALGEQEDVVRVLSIHKAKGLEFPVVFVMDLGKRFNTDDLRRDILFHRDLGIGAQYCDLRSRVKYPSLAHQAIALKTREENLAEEMRVLYVALTRAKEKLCLVGSARDLPKKIERWQQLDIPSAVTYLDWLCPVILEDRGSPFCVRFWGTEDGRGIPLPQETRLMSDYIADNEPGDRGFLKTLMDRLTVGSNEAAFQEVKRRLEWTYPFAGLTTTPARMSVGELKRRLDNEEEDSWRFIPSPRRRLAFGDGAAQSKGIRRGIATHTVLARMDLRASGSIEDVRAEAVRLADLGFLEQTQVDEVDASSIAAFFTTTAGQMLTANPDRVKRELPFTLSVPARFMGLTDNEERSAFGGLSDTGDEVLLQGIIDVLVEDDDGLTILDYKTDTLSGGQVDDAVARYSPQVSLYALAAETILKKPIRKVVIAFLTPGENREVDWRGYLASRGFAL